MSSITLKGDDLENYIKALNSNIKRLEFEKEENKKSFDKIYDTILNEKYERIGDYDSPKGKRYFIVKNRLDAYEQAKEYEDKYYETRSEKIELENKNRVLNSKVYGLEKEIKDLREEIHNLSKELNKQDKTIEQLKNRNLIQRIFNK